MGIDLPSSNDALLSPTIPIPISVLKHLAAKHFYLPIDTVPIVYYKFCNRVNCDWIQTDHKWTLTIGWNFSSKSTGPTSNSDIVRHRFLRQTCFAWPGCNSRAKRLASALSEWDRGQPKTTNFHRLFCYVHQDCDNFPRVLLKIAGELLHFVIAQMSELLGAASLGRKGLGMVPYPMICNWVRSLSMVADMFLFRWASIRRRGPKW